MDIIKAPNLGLIKKIHENKWVAFSMDYKKLLAVAGSLIGLRKMVGKVKAVYMHVLPADVSYAPTTL